MAFATKTIALGITALLFLVTLSTGCVDDDDTLILVIATTTSTYDSGLLDEVLPVFEKGHSVTVKVVAVGTGQALEMGRSGDADVLLVHARAAELELMGQGYGLERREVMYNQFLVAGPDDDPANLTGAGNITTAFTRIHDDEAAFTSRGDDSGTHKREQELWEAAGYDYDTELDTEATEEWYLQTGQGMGATLTIANEKDAYVLVDEGTWYARADDLDHLRVAFSGDPLLFNQYGVIAVNHTSRPDDNERPALEFVEWLSSTEGQQLIGDFTMNGRQLFTPNYTPG